jgi:hypothetical protein
MMPLRRALVAAVDVDDDEATADAADLLRSIDAALLVANIMLSCLSFRFVFSACEMKMAWA